MIRVSWLAMLLVASVAISACVQTGERVQRTDRNSISIEEIEQAQMSSMTAFEVVQRLRPGWFRARGVKLPRRGPLPSGESWTQDIPVYLDNVRFGGNVTALRNIAADRVRRIERLLPGEAQARLGSGHPSGAIIVRSR
jgi:hypothetical protein